MEQICKICGLPCKSRKALREHMKSVRHFNFSDSNVVDINPKKKKNKRSRYKKFIGKPIGLNPKKKEEDKECSFKDVGSTIRKSYMGSKYRASSNHQVLGKHWVVEEFESLKKKHKIL